MDYGQLMEGISDTQDRLLMSELIKKVFLPFEQEMEERFKALEHRLYDEIFLGEQEAVVCEGIYAPGKEKLPDGFYEELEESSQPKDTSQFQNATSEQYEEGEIVREIFLTCGGEQLIKIWEKPPVLSGAVLYQDKEYPVKLTLQKDIRYEERIRSVWNVIDSNGCRMHTPNLPYSNRMAVISIHGLPQEIKLPREDSELLIDYAQYQEVIKEDVRPFWNIEWRKGKTFGFPLPCGDEVHYEHKIRIPKDEVQDAFYLIWDEQGGSIIRRGKDEICVSVGDEDSRVFWLLRIRAVGTEIESFGAQEIASAKLADSFSKRFESLCGKIPETTSELQRLIAAIDQTHRFILESVEFDVAAQGDTYDMNQFRRQNTTRVETRMPVVLTFRYQGRRDYLVIDRLSYIVSCIQEYYKDYNCIGKLR